MFAEVLSPQKTLGPQIAKNIGSTIANPQITILAKGPQI
jgi:hypothetical protein